MSGELCFDGVYFPPLLVLCILSLVASHACGRILARLNFYRLVWHPAMFDCAMFVLILGILQFLFPYFS